MDFVPYIITMFIVVSIYQLQLEVKKINDKLSKILDYIGVNEIDEELENELRELLLKNKYVKAIKRYRSVTDQSLKVSKDYIDNLKAIIDSEK